MIIIITLFYASLLTIVVMVSWKLVVLRKLKLSLIEGAEKELHGKFYEMVHELWHVFRAKVLDRVRVFAISVFFTVAHEVLHFAGIMGAKLKERHSKWFDMVKGKGVINKKGSASFFLRSVAEYKESTESKESKSL